MPIIVITVIITLVLLTGQITLAAGPATSSYVLYHSAYFEKALEHTQGVLGTSQVHVVKEQGLQVYLQTIQQDLAAKKIKSGDQVILQIFAHGQPQGLEQTHSLIGPGENNNLDLLLPLRQSLEDAGVKVAIFDGSCYSGNSLALGSEKTCVISSQSRNFPATAIGGDTYANFMEIFWEQKLHRRPQITALAELFLAAREHLQAQTSFRLDRPEISTPWYFSVRNNLDQWFASLQEKRWSVRDLSEKYQQNIQQLVADEFYCDPNFLLTNENISQLQKISLIQAFGELKNLLTNYYQDLAKLELLKKHREEYNQQREQILAKNLEEKILSQERVLLTLLGMVDNKKSACQSFLL